MKDYQAYLIDLDGTIYRGHETIQSGVSFANQLMQAGKQVIFLTNNTTRTPQMVVDKLTGHGVAATIEQIYTPCLATYQYLKQLRPEGLIKVYLIGQIGLFQELMSHEEIVFDEERPDFVIVGMDTDLTYHKVRVACRAIRNGATFIGTNQDQVLPAGDELLPGNGSQCAMIEVATGVKPIFIGKPSNIIVDFALAKFKLTKRDALIVGDNYLTDIKAGLNAGVDTLLTLTGVTKKAELAGLKQPTYLVDNLGQIKL